VAGTNINGTTPSPAVMSLCLWMGLVSRRIISGSDQRLIVWPTVVPVWALRSLVIAWPLVIAWTLVIARSSVISRSLVIAWPWSITLVAVAMVIAVLLEIARRVLMGVPVVAHEEYALMACVITTAVAIPVALMSWWNAQIDRCLIWRWHWADKDRLRIDYLRWRVAANV